MGVLKVFKLALESSLDTVSALVDEGEFIIDDKGGDIGGNDVELAWRDFDESDVVDTRRDWSRFGGGGFFFSPFSEFRDELELSELVDGDGDIDLDVRFWMDQ